MGTEVEFDCEHCGGAHTYMCDVGTEEDVADAAIWTLFTDKLNLSRDTFRIQAEVAGETWVTNGHILVRKDRAFSDGLEFRPERKPGDIAKALIQPATFEIVKVGVRGLTKAFTPSRPARELIFADGQKIYCHERYFAVLADCDEWRTERLGKPLFGFRGGELQGLIMPLRPGAETFVPEPTP